MIESHSQGTIGKEEHHREPNQRGHSKPTKEIDIANTADPRDGFRPMLAGLSLRRSPSRRAALVRGEGQRLVWGATLAGGRKLHSFRRHQSVGDVSGGDFQSRVE